MKFVAYDRDKCAKMSTTYVECLPDIDTLTSMTSVGYTFKIDGKQVSIKDIEAIRKLDNIEPHTACSSKGIQCVQTQEVFKTQAEAARHFGLDSAQVSESVRKGKIVKGLSFIKV